MATPVEAGTVAVDRTATIRNTASVFPLSKWGMCNLNLRHQKDVGILEKGVWGGLITCSTERPGAKHHDCYGEYA